MKKIAESYFKNLSAIVSRIKVRNGNGRDLDFYSGVEEACKLIRSNTGNGNKVIFIGNGGSAAISSHMAIDFWKNGGIRATAFNDSSLLTCISNDYGYRHVFEKPLEMFANEGDVLIAISSSGNSENILRGVDAACLRKCKVITLSGFKEGNPLSMKGDLAFYVPAEEYGPVEVLHHTICHCILDTLMKASS